jgi:hypothetical protein
MNNSVNNTYHNDLFKKNNLIIYVVRYSKSGIIGDSAPCYDCYNKMCELGVKTLVFSSGEGIDGAGEYTKMRFRDYLPRQKSLGRYYIELGFKQVHRIQGTNKLEDDFGNPIMDNYLLSGYDNVIPERNNTKVKRNKKEKKSKMWDKQFNKLKSNKTRRKSQDSYESGINPGSSQSI